MVSKEEAQAFLSWARGPEANIGEPGSQMRTIAKLAVQVADERDRLAAQVAELVALASKCVDHLRDAEEMVDSEAFGDPSPGYDALADEVEIVLARIGATP